MFSKKDVIIPLLTISISRHSNPSESNGRDLKPRSIAYLSFIFIFSEKTFFDNLSFKKLIPRAIAYPFSALNMLFNNCAEVSLLNTTGTLQDGIFRAPNLFKVFSAAFFAISSALFKSEL